MRSLVLIDVYLEDQLEVTACGWTQEEALADFLEQVRRQWICENKLRGPVSARRHIADVEKAYAYLRTMTDSVSVKRRLINVPPCKCCPPDPSNLQKVR